ncbi:helix-hairpin-helix domain-containing protein [Gottfriedia solisilvae]|uniref:Competence protein CelA n=1 Tax=Gottfriedia solisilvae TaxID=1516104 RepID=A0A8J3EWP3_9BACI|nr:helix-hairpin-helix domain-containing protein [Gottfriedia solisilvae]GGI10696.1 competence protein CelA [Gottfriedia solisilvae]
MFIKIIRNKFFWLTFIIALIFTINLFQSNRQNEVIVTPEASQTKDSNIVDRNDVAKENKQNIEQEEIIVDLKGAVTTPGIFRLEVGSRVNDAIKLAGGFKSGADRNKVNLAEKLKDEMVIYVPKIGEETVGEVSSVTNDEADHKESVDINHATMEELQKIPGIGPSKAKNIIEYIEMNGSFTSIEQLDEVNGIGTKSLEQMRPFILIR